MATAISTGAASGSQTLPNANVDGKKSTGALKTGQSPAAGTVHIDTLGNDFVVPDFTIKDILSAIPAKCYKRSAIRSLGYVARDLFCIIGVGLLAIYNIPKVQSVAARIALWTAYVIIQGLQGTGIWVLAHECGHGAFSDYPVLNDTVGWILHSSLFVPYFSWKYSHSRHHKSTGHMTRDMVFVPKTREEFLEYHQTSKIEEVTADTPIVTLFWLIAQQLVGWLLYLFTDVTSGKKYPNVPKWKINHFVPSSPLYFKGEYWNIVLSDIGVLLNGYAVYKGFEAFGAANMIIHYILPWIGVNHWLVFITYLQHTDPSMSHYESEVWNFAIGAAATIDRDFGFIGKHIFHDIIETHVLHHYVSRIPFYNGREGTKEIKKVMGKHYKYNGENMLVSLYKTARSCQFVEPDGSGNGGNHVLMFRNTNNIGVKPLPSK